GEEDIMRSYSGQCALNPWRGFFKDPTLHVGIDFDDKILTWYFATEIFLSWSSPREECVEEQDYVEAIRAVSNYMIFLLAERPYMLPSPVRVVLYANAKAAYVGLDFSNREQISRKLGMDRRRRMWELDTKTDVDELQRASGKLDIIREDLDITRDDLGTAREDLDSSQSWHNRSELERTREELNRRCEELDNLRLEVGSKRDKLEVLDRRRKELDDTRERWVLMFDHYSGGGKLEELNRRRSEVDSSWEKKQNLNLQRLNTAMKRIEELDRSREELDRTRAEVAGGREENLNLDPEELNRRMEKLEELYRRSEELRFGPSPPAPAPLARGAALAVWLLELEARGEQEVRQVLLGVWVEMLCYAAHHCSRDSHARQLNSGGELVHYRRLASVHCRVQ
uniref:Uncharacterized protein n=4 Tax=Aegilops tauschii TaxID=37682 RepID=A0A453DK91_AEGTS